MVGDAQPDDAAADDYDPSRFIPRHRSAPYPHPVRRRSNSNSNEFEAVCRFGADHGIGFGRRLRSRPGDGHDPYRQRTWRCAFTRRRRDPEALLEERPTRRIGSRRRPCRTTSSRRSCACAIANRRNCRSRCSGPSWRTSTPPRRISGPCAPMSASAHLCRDRQRDGAGRRARRPGGCRTPCDGADHA